MAQRRFHYDAAFEHFLRARGIPYVAVDEAKRALRGQARQLKLKNFDFVVYSENQANLLVDVKGRKHAGKGRSFQNWVTRDDIDSLTQWQTLFGPGFEATFAYLFWCVKPPADALFLDVFEYADRWYAILAVKVADYQKHMRKRSDRWDTVAVPAKAFDEIALPLNEML